MREERKEPDEKTEVLFKYRNSVCVQLRGKEHNNMYLLLREVVVRLKNKQTNKTLANLCQGSSANNNNIL